MSQFNTYSYTLFAASTSSLRYIKQFEGEERFHNVKELCSVLENDVTVAEIVRAEINIFSVVVDDLPYLFAPLEIIRNMLSLLDAKLDNDTQEEMTLFVENITNFVMWSKWAEYSPFTISVTTMMVFCEFNNYNDYIKEILDLVSFFSEKTGTDLFNEMQHCRQFIFENLYQLSEDEALILKARYLNSKPLYIMYEDHFKGILNGLKVK
jgi:hypothetical protein